MEFPERDVALAWVGRTLVDRDGVEIGVCTAVFSDDATELTEWVCAELDGGAVFIPAVGAVESNGDVRVAVSRAGVASAPSVGGTQHISDDEEATLYRHYGIPHSRDNSPSLLPTGDGQAPAANGSDAAAAEPAVSAAPVVTDVAAPRTESIGAAGPDESTSAAGPDESTETAPPAGRRRVVSVAGGLAGVGLALGAVLGARRLRRRRPPTRTELLAARGRAASAALSARTSRIAASAGPVLETTKRVARRPGRTGAIASGVPAAVALALAAVRRRRSGASRTTE